MQKIMKDLKIFETMTITKNIKNNCLKVFLDGKLSGVTIRQFSHYDAKWFQSNKGWELSKIADKFGVCLTTFSINVYGVWQTGKSCQIKKNLNA
jgi:hypothetical protein